MSTSKFHVGQEVIYIGHHGKRSTETVTRVGRKYAYLWSDSTWRETGFDLETGIQKSDRYYGSVYRITTPEMLAEADRCTAALARLRELGLVPGGYGRNDFTADQLEAIIAVLEGR